VHGETVGLGDHGDDVHLVAQLLHEVNVQRLEFVSVGRDEVKAAVDSIVNDVLPVEAALVL